MMSLKTALLASLISPAMAVAATPSTPRPATTPADLFQAIVDQDAALFGAYNTCDLKKFDSLLAPDIEFFHDHGGVTLGHAALTESIKKNICGKLTRELLPDSLEVYPMDNYGALEIGTHRFHQINAEKAEPDGEGKFVMLWQYDKPTKTWKVTRVFSFDHHEAKK